MATESILSATFGTPGSGKTYSRCKWLVDDFLVNNPSGLYITNIPLNIDEICKFISESRKVSYNEVSDRLIVIPDDVLLQWEKLNHVESSDLKTFSSDTFPPTLYFQQFNLSGAHIAIDEFHKYFGKKSPRPLRALWNDWFAEIRKTGCVFEAITQSYGQMNDEFLDKCQTRLELVNHSDSKDPFFQIRMGDWYELKAGIFGHLPLQRVSERETMRGTSVSGKVVWKPTSKSRSYLLTPFYFRFYNSFRNYTGSSSERQSPSQIYKRRIWLWFLRRNLLNIVPRFFLVILVLWFLLGGGFNFCLMKLVSGLGAVGKSNSPAAQIQPGQIQPGQIQRGQIQPGQIQPGQIQPGQIQPGQIQPGQIQPRQDFFDEYKPAFFYGDMCVLRNSLEVFVNFKFTGGLYDGLEIVEIDPKKRLYRLSDDTVVRMY